MNKRNIILIATSATLFGGIALLVANKLKKDKEEKQKQNEETQTQKPTPQGSANTPVIAESVIGKKAYVSSKNGLINLRETPKVDNGIVDNLITTIKGSGTPIGKIISVQKSDQNPPEDWYEIKLDKPVKEWMISWDVVFVHAADVDVK